MERLISELVSEYEAGKLTRRQLIQGLTATAAFTISLTSAVAQGNALKASGVDHISYLVSDYARTRDFYVDLLGMSIILDDPANQMCALRFGESVLVIRMGNDAASFTERSTVDHFSVYIDDWDTDRVRVELERRGHQPRLDTAGVEDNYASFHITDPDGYNLQIAGVVKRGDPLYREPER